MISTSLCLALTANFSQHNIYQSQTPARSPATTINCWMLLTNASKYSIPDVPGAQLLNMLLLDI